MSEAGDDVGRQAARLHEILFQYDAFAHDGPPRNRVLVFGVAPRLGDTVLLIENRVPRLERFRRTTRWGKGVWIVAVVRIAVGLFIVVMDAL